MYHEEGAPREEWILFSANGVSNLVARLILVARNRNYSQPTGRHLYTRSTTALRSPKGTLATLSELRGLMD